MRLVNGDLSPREDIRTLYCPWNDYTEREGTGTGETKGQSTTDDTIPNNGMERNDYTGGKGGWLTGKCRNKFELTSQLDTDG